MNAEAVMWVLLVLLAMTAAGLTFTVLRLLRMVDDEREARGEADSHRDGWMKYALELEPFAQGTVDQRFAQSPAPRQWNEGTGMHAVRGDAT